MRLERSLARRGVSLVEILVVIAIIGVLIGLLFPAVQSIRERSNVSQCQNNLRQLGIAFRNYESHYRKMPAYSTGRALGTQAGNWQYYLLPYMEADFAAGKPGSPCPTCGQNKVFSSGQTTVQVPILSCPSDPTADLERYWATTNYLANWYALSGGQGGYYAPALPLQSLSNGLANSVIFAEGYKVCSGRIRMELISNYYHNFGITQNEKPSDDPYYLPNDYTMFQVRPGISGGPDSCNNWRAQTPHTAMNVGLGDGSVRTVDGSISAETWKRVLKRSSGVPGSDWTGP